MEKLAAYVVREGALSTRDAVGWISRLSSTLAPIHGLGVAHGRVSAKAIQIASPSCDDAGYLLDASDLADDPAYHSPERLLGGARDPRDDCWAIAVTLYSVLTGQLPFRGATPGEILTRIEEAPPAPLAVFDMGDDEVQRVIDRALDRDPRRRVAELDELRAALTAWDRSLADLPALRFGAPPTGQEDDFDDDEAILTAVYDFRLDAQDTKPRPAAGSAGVPQKSSGAIPFDEKPAPRPLSTVPPAPPDVDEEDEGPTVLAAMDEDAIAPTSVRRVEDLPLPPPPAPAAPREEDIAAPPVSSRPVEPLAAPPVSSRPVELEPVEPAPPSSEEPIATDRGAPAPPLPRPPAASEPSFADEPSSASPVVSSSTWPPKKDAVLAEASAARRRRRRGLILFAALLLGAAGGAVYATVIRPALTSRSTSTAAEPTSPSSEPTSTAARASAPHATTASGDPSGSASGSTSATVASAAAAASAKAEAPTAAEGDAAAAPDASPEASGSAEAPSASAASPDAAESASAASPDDEPVPAPDEDASTDAADVNRCALALFPNDTFEGAESDFSFACNEPDPVDGAATIRRMVIEARGNRGVTDGMREWAAIGWYGMAAFTILRASCCEAPPPLASPAQDDHGPCRLDERLQALGEAAREREELASQAALKDYGKAIYCLINRGAGHTVGQSGVPRVDELTTFGKTLGRALRR